MAAITSTTESWNNHKFSEVESHIKGNYIKTSDSEQMITSTITTMGGGAIDIYRKQANSYSMIGFSNNNGSGTKQRLGFLGFATEIDVPCFYKADGNGLYKLWHEGNLTPSNYSLTSHTHSNYSLTSHTHSNYSLTSHTHSGYAASTTRNFTAGGSNWTVYSPFDTTVNLDNYYSSTSHTHSYLPLSGGNMTGHIYLTGAQTTSSVANTTQLIFGTSSSNHACISSNDNAVIINPNVNNTAGQIKLGVNGQTSFFSSSGNFGINTTSPSYGLDVSGTGHFTSDVTFDANVVNTYYVLNSSSTNPYLLLKQGNYMWYIQGYNDYLFLGYGSAKSVKIDPSGNLTSPAGITALSDARHKQVISDTPITVEQVAKMPSVLFKWTDGNHNDELHIGTLAQSWQSVLPQAVLKEDNEEGTLSFNYGVAALVSSITTARDVVAMKEIIKKLEERISELEK